VRDFAEKVMKEREEVVSIVLFGSRARGDYTAYSDYDVLVVVSHSEERFIDRPLRYLEYSEEPLELFIYTTSEVETMFDDANVLILDALRDGVVLYDKGFWRELRGKFLVLLEKGVIRPTEVGWAVSVRPLSAALSEA